MTGWCIKYVDRDIIDFEVLPIEYPEDMTERLANHGKVDVSVKLRANPTPEFAEWTKNFNVVYDIVIEDDSSVTINLESEVQAMWFKMRWM